MSNDSSQDHQRQAAQPQLLAPGNLPEGAPAEMSYYGPEMGLTSLDSVLRLVSFSKKHLRKRFVKNHKEKVKHMWLTLAMTICDDCPWDDRRTYALALVEELATLAGVTISDDDKRNWYSQLYPGIHNEGYPRIKYAKNE